MTIRRMNLRVSALRKNGNVPGITDEFFAQAEDEAVIITRSDGQDRVLLSKQEYESLLETAYLLSTGANAARLHDAVAEIEAIT